jgi:hypothetical protein
VIRPCNWLMAVSALVTSSCSAPEPARETPARWTELNAENIFTFHAPAGTVKAPLDGIPFDSFVQRYQNANFTIQFDYGHYSNQLGDLRHSPKYSVEKIWIDDRPAIVVSGSGDGAWGCNDHMTALYVVDRLTRGGQIALQMDGCTSNPNVIPIIHDIFKSIRFKYDAPSAWLHYFDSH